MLVQQFCRAQPAARLPRLQPGALHHSRQTHVFIFHSFAFLIFLSGFPSQPKPPEWALQCASVCRPQLPANHIQVALRSRSERTSPSL